MELGPPVEGPPHRLVGEALLKQHRVRSTAQVRFYASAAVTTPAGQRLTFTAGESWVAWRRGCCALPLLARKAFALGWLTGLLFGWPATCGAGDTSHAGRLLYDVGPQQHAYVLVCSIYTLEDGGEPYIAHKYFFTASDMRERPAWSAWLGRQAGVQEEELLLSSGIYLSPAGLLVGECGVVYALDKAQGGRSAPLPPYFPCYQCRRAFAAAACAGTPLALALSEV